jgi:TRAP-type mannitol/chloroaromatic compound transport system permease small subunit
MRALLPVSRLIDRISAAAGRLAEWLVLAACLVTAGNATLRYLYHGLPADFQRQYSSSSNAWLEIQWYMFGALVFLGASHTLRVNEHVRVDLIYASVSDRARLWIDAVGLTLFLLPVSIYLTYLSVPFFVRSFQLGEYSNSAGGLILWPIKLILPVGFALLTLQGISELIKRVAALHGELALDTHYEKPLQ